MPEQETVTSSSRTSAMGMLIRAAVWICVALFFLVNNLSKIGALHQAGQPIPGWTYVQVGLWLLVLGFWSWSAWKQWQRRKAERKVS